MNGFHKRAWKLNTAHSSTRWASKNLAPGRSTRSTHYDTFMHATLGLRVMGVVSQPRESWRKDSPQCNFHWDRHFAHASMLPIYFLTNLTNGPALIESQLLRACLEGHTTVRDRNI